MKTKGKKRKERREMFETSKKAVYRTHCRENLRNLPELIPAENPNDWTPFSSDNRFLARHPVINCTRS